eukprot:312788-Hanusia_phi.AAC.1
MIEKKPPDPDKESKKRTLTDVAARKARNKLFEFSCVVMRWSTFCKDDIIKNHIEQFVWNVNKIALEAYHLANMHILRCLHNNIPLPKLDQTFYYRCCAGIVVKPGGRSSHASTGDDQIDETIKVFKTLRPASNYQPPAYGHMTFLMCNLARQMKVAGDNHIVLNFGKRLLRYVKLRYNLTSPLAWRFINESFNEDIARTPEQ